MSAEGCAGQGLLADQGEEGDGEGGDTQENAAGHAGAIRTVADHAIGNTGTAALTISVATNKAATAEKATRWRASNRTDMMTIPCISGGPDHPSADAGKIACAVPVFEAVGFPRFICAEPRSIVSRAN